MRRHYNIRLIHEMLYFCILYVFFFHLIKSQTDPLIQSMGAGLAILGASCIIFHGFNYKHWAQPDRRTLQSCSECYIPRDKVIGMSSLTGCSNGLWSHQPSQNSTFKILTKLHPQLNLYIHAYCLLETGLLASVIYLYICIYIYISQNQEHFSDQIGKKEFYWSIFFLINFASKKL